MCKQHGFTVGMRVWVADENSEGTITAVDDFNVVVYLDSDQTSVSCGHVQVTPLL